MITVIDYGVGNVGSILNIFRKVDIEAHASSDVKEIAKAKKLVLCGVGAFDDGMQKLRSMGLVDVIQHRVRCEQVPILGVCLGMQLLTRGSEEGNEPGLGLVSAEAKRMRFEVGAPHKVPHVGWKEVSIAKPSKLFESMYDNPRFYFVHSFYVCTDRSEDVFLTAHHGFDFCAGFEHNNVVGVQFHPEKSHKFGMRLYENFATRFP